MAIRSRGHLQGMRIFGFGDNRVSGMVHACEATSELGPAIIDLSMCHPGHEDTTECGQRGRQGRRRGKMVRPQGEKLVGQKVTLGGGGVALLAEGWVDRCGLVQARSVL